AMSRAGDPRVGARMGRGPYLARAQQLALLRARARRRHAARQRILTAFLALIATLFFAIGANALDRYDYYTGDLPDPSHLSPQNLAQATTIFDRKGRVLYVQHKPGEIRTVVPLAKISPLLQKATVDLEDRNFYQHHGLDYPRLAKAAYSDLTHSGIAQGGSTITQQLVKSLYTGQERSLDRKIKE